MATLKTRENDSSVANFLSQLEPEPRRADAHAVCALMAEVTGAPAKMWGTNIVGFGRSNDWFLVGFSPRKAALTLYIMPGFSGYEGMLSRLGKYKTGRSCLYINKLSDVDADILRALVTASVEDLKAAHT